MVRKLAEGGMGEVYLAEDLRLGRNVVLKILNASGAADAARDDRFRREARALASLNHPNVVVVYELGDHDGVTFIATEFIAGQTLRDALPPRSDTARILDIAIGIATGIAAAHAAGVIHRDIKPENVMITAGGTPKILDFGLAKLFMATPNQVTDLKTSDGTVMGTLDYMSPEQLRGEAVDSATDAFSFGVLLFELIAGHRPFPGKTFAEIASAILTQSTPRLPGHSLAPLDLEPIVLQLLEKNAAARLSVADALPRLREIRETLTARAHVIATRAPHSDPPSRDIADARVFDNLPAQPTEIVGRAGEIVALYGRLVDPAVRLITITGSGGIGKSRLAIAAAEAARTQFRRGVCFVSLDSVARPSLLPSAIAGELGVRDVPGEALERSIAHELAGSAVLLILDNFEHVMEAAPFIASLLAATPQLKILVTSQSPLHLRGEYEFPLSPLDVATESARLDEIESSASFTLFVNRVKQSGRELVLTDDRIRTVAAICRLLNGIPLAIELAAARAKMLTPEAVLQRLGDPLSLLVGGPRDLPARQQTIRATLQWSHALLSDPEKELFGQCAAFVGGWTLEAAEAVCVAADGASVVESLESLMEKSLIRRDDRDGAPRFSMFGTIAAFALAATPPPPALRERHALYYARFLEEMAPRLVGSGSAEAMEEIERERGNISAATEWLLAAARVNNGARIALSMSRYWFVRGLYREGRELLARIGAAPDVDASLRAQLAYGAGILADAQQDFAAARESFSEALDLNRRAGDEWGTTNSLNNLGVIAIHEGDYAKAEELLSDVARRWAGLGNEAATALALQNLGNLARSRGALAEARELYARSAEIFRRSGDRHGIALSLNRLGDVARRQGEQVEARRLYDESLEIFIAEADHANVAATMADLGDLLRASGELHEAAGYLEESLLIYQQLRDLKNAARQLHALALLAATRQQDERAVTLAAAAAATRRAIGVALSDDERQTLEDALAAVRERAGAKFAEFAAAGDAMTFAEAVRFADSGAME